MRNLYAHRAQQVSAGRFESEEALLLYLLDPFPFFFMAVYRADERHGITPRFQRPSNPNSVAAEEVINPAHASSFDRGPRMEPQHPPPSTSKAVVAQPTLAAVMPTDLESSGAALATDRSVQSAGVPQSNSDASNSKTKRTAPLTADYVFTQTVEEEFV